MFPFQKLVPHTPKIHCDENTEWSEAIQLLNNCLLGTGFIVLLALSNSMIFHDFFHDLWHALNPACRKDKSASFFKLKFCWLTEKLRHWFHKIISMKWLFLTLSHTHPKLITGSNSGTMAKVLVSHKKCGLHSNPGVDQCRMCSLPLSFLEDVFLWNLRFSPLLKATLPNFNLIRSGRWRTTVWMGYI